MVKINNQRQSRNLYGKTRCGTPLVLLFLLFAAKLSGQEESAPESVDPTIHRIQSIEFDNVARTENIDFEE